MEPRRVPLPVTMPPPRPPCSTARATAISTMLPTSRGTARSTGWAPTEPSNAVNGRDPHDPAIEPARAAVPDLARGRPWRQRVVRARVPRTVPRSHALTCDAPNPRSLRAPNRPVVPPRPNPLLGAHSRGGASSPSRSAHPSPRGRGGRGREKGVARADAPRGPPGSVERACVGPARAGPRRACRLPAGASHALGPATGGVPGRSRRETVGRSEGRSPRRPRAMRPSARPARLAS